MDEVALVVMFIFLLALLMAYLCDQCKRGRATNVLEMHHHTPYRGYFGDGRESQSRLSSAIGHAPSGSRDSVFALLSQLFARSQPPVYSEIDLDAAPPPYEAVVAAAAREADSKINALENGTLTF